MKPSKIEISTQQASIRIGEPLIVRLTYRWEEPLVSEANEVPESVEHDAHLEVAANDGNSVACVYPIFPFELRSNGMEGLGYSNHFVILYNHVKKRMMFDREGVYRISVAGRMGSSNSLDIKVEPASKLDEKAASLLSDPNDYYFLVHGVDEAPPDKRAERVSRFGQVVEQCEGTVLARWCAGRLGLEYFRKFHLKYPSLAKFKTEKLQGEAEESVFDLACAYLTIGSKLSDKFPIREQVIYKLSVAEYIKGDWERAFSMVDELGDKYANGKYGKKASFAKAELERLKQEERPKVEPMVSEQTADKGEPNTGGD